MDNRYYENVISEMKPFLDENGFASFEDGFVNENKKVLVQYNDEKQTYSLLVADKDADGNFGEAKSINTWLFDDSQNAKDATSVGVDFTVSLRKELGIKITRATSDVELPTATKSGNVTVTGFTKKMLDIFPSLKDEYKNHISLYGNFLYVNFFGEHLVPELKNLFSNDNKKQIKKLYDVFEDAYIKGDKDTVNIVVALLSAVAFNDEAVNKVIEAMLAENPHFLQSFKSFSVKFPKSKKLFSALVK